MTPLCPDPGRIAQRLASWSILGFRLDLEKDSGAQTFNADIETDGARSTTRPARSCPRICSACTGADKDKPILGLVIVKDISPGGDRHKGGSILDSEGGRVYRAELWSEKGTPTVRGFLGPLYATQTWVKAK